MAVEVDNAIVRDSNANPVLMAALQQSEKAKSIAREIMKDPAHPQRRWAKSVLFYEHYGLTRTR